MVGRESFFCFAMQKQFVINVVIRPFRRAALSTFQSTDPGASRISDCSLRISDARFDFDCQIFLSPTLEDAVHEWSLGQRLTEPWTTRRIWS